MKCAIGLVQPMSGSNGVQFGFSILNEDGKPICSFGYATKEEAVAGEQLVRRAVEEAADVRSYS